METEKIEAGDVYALLSCCSKEDLDPLVQVVLKKTMNFLEVDENYKKFQPDHTKYTDKIADEIRSFGGHSVRNIFRGSGPEYSEIVIDVCKKLDVPHVKGRTVLNEKNLLDIFVERNWKNLSDEERTALAEQAKMSASSQHTSLSISSVGQVGAAVVIGALFSGPIGWAAFGFGLMSSSFKVTIPCVLHIAYLRQKVLGPIKFNALLGNETSLIEKSESSLDALEKNNFGSVSIDDQQGKNLLLVQEIWMPNEEVWKKTERDSGVSALAGSLMQVLPISVVAQDVNSTRYMRVVVDGALAKANKGGGYRGFVSGNGTIKHANLFDPVELVGAVNFAAVFQVASVLVAQKHLWDINKKLDEIKKTISEIQQFQRNERRSRISGNIRYFEQIAPSVLEGDLGPDILNKIELGESEFLQIQDHIYEDVLNWKAEFDKEYQENAKPKVSVLQDELFKLTNLCVEYFMCVRARACGWFLLSQMSVMEGRKVRRKGDIVGSLDFIDKMNECAQSLRKIGALTHYSSKKDNAEKLVFLKDLDEAVDRMFAVKQTISAELSIDLLTDKEIEGPVTMLLKVEKGELTGVRPG